MNGLSKDAVSWLTVGDDGEGQRVDNYLVSRLKGVPKSHIYRIVRKGEVRVNKGRVGPDARLAAGDVVRVPPVRTASAPNPGHSGPSRRFAPTILHEDDALIVVDKPAGLAVHGGSGIALGLIEQLRVARPEAKFLELVHRLDRDTSGILLIAKRRSALTGLHTQLRDGAVEKRYLALIRGQLTDSTVTVDVPLHKFSTREGERRVRVGPFGRESVTVLRREKVWARRDPPLTLVEAELKTGRTHQIRVHLAHIGCALAGDGKYGDFQWNRQLTKEGLKRMFLHARKLTFEHPITGVRMSIVSQIPSELARYMEGLG